MAAVRDAEDEIVAIHDAARPLVSPASFDLLGEALAVDREAVGAIAATPVADTIKRASTAAAPATIEATVERAALWAAQTPQLFRAEALRDAQGRAAAAGSLEQATDEAWLLEGEAARVLLVAVADLNLKVTTEADLDLAAAILERRGRV